MPEELNGWILIKLPTIVAYDIMSHQAKFGKFSHGRSRDIPTQSFDAKSYGLKDNVQYWPLLGKLVFARVDFGFIGVN